MNVGSVYRVRFRHGYGALLLLTALVLPGLVGCGDDDDTGDVQSGPAPGSESPTRDDSTGSDPISGADLDGRTFLSTAVEGYDLVDGSGIRLTFDGTRLVVNAGCNTISGDFAVDDTGSPASTGRRSVPQSSVGSR